MEQAFDTKLDAKFNELLTRLPLSPVGPRRQGYVGHAQRVPLERGQNSGVAAALDGNFDEYEGEDEYEGVEVQQQAPGRPRAHIRNDNDAPRDGAPLRGLGSADPNEKWNFVTEIGRAHV